ncbi:MAG: WXG100 family type VII secretion target [Nocardioides sp.]
MSIGLEFGELNQAAQTVADAIGPVGDMLTTLSDSVAASATGFKGQAASGLGEAIGAWFDVASTLGPALQQYATALATTSAEHVVNEGDQLSSYSDLAGRLGGGE